MKLEQQIAAGLDTFRFAQPPSFVFNTDVSMVAVLIDRDLEHPVEIDRCFQPVGAEIVALGAEGFGVRHHLVHGIVAVHVVGEVTEIGKSPEVRRPDGIDERDQQFGIRGRTAVVFDDDVDALGPAQLDQFGKSID